MWPGAGLVTNMVYMSAWANGSASMCLHQPQSLEQWPCPAGLLGGIALEQTYPACHQRTALLTCCLRLWSCALVCCDWIATTFCAARAGVFMSLAAGNSGPTPSTASNNGPWSVSVAASTIPRQLWSMLVLGNGDTVPGVGSVASDFGPEPMYYASGSSAQLCNPDSLDPDQAAGKIVVRDTCNQQPLHVACNCLVRLQHCLYTNTMLITDERTTHTYVQTGNYPIAKSYRLSSGSTVGPTALTAPPS